MALLQTTAALITRTIKDVANIPDPTVGNHARLRERTLAQAQEGLAELWLDPDGFTWTRGDANITISSQTGLLPTDFREIGADGTVWSALGAQLDWVPPWRVQHAQEAQVYPAYGGLCVYSIFGQTTDMLEDPPTMNQLIQFPPGFDAEVVTLRGYKKQVPELADNDSASGLEQVPGDVVLLYLSPYLRFRMYDDRNDQRAGVWEKRYKSGYTIIKANDRQGKDTPQEFVGYYHFEEDEF